MVVPFHILHFVYLLRIPPSHFFFRWQEFAPQNIFEAIFKTNRYDKFDGTFENTLTGLCAYIFFFGWGMSIKKGFHTRTRTRKRFHKTQNSRERKNGENNNIGRDNVSYLSAINLTMKIQSISI